MKQFSYRQCVPTDIIPKSCKNGPSCIKSQVDYWLHLPTLVMSSTLCYSYISEHYLMQMNKQDAEVRKVLYVKENAIQKGITVNDSPQNVKRAKNPTSQKAAPSVIKDNKSKKD